MFVKVLTVKCWWCVGIAWGTAYGRQYRFVEYINMVCFVMVVNVSNFIERTEMHKNMALHMVYFFMVVNIVNFIERTEIHKKYGLKPKS